MCRTPSYRRVLIAFAEDEVIAQKAEASMAGQFNGRTE
jgi:hypothetical protein